MKRMMSFLLAGILLLGLCACGPKEPTPTEANPTEASTTAAPTQSVEERKALAEACIDKPVEELYELIGQPNSSDYAPSCMGDGEDGNLYYDGFIVYTYREGDEESVYFVE